MPTSFPGLFPFFKFGEREKVLGTRLAPQGVSHRDNTYRQYCNGACVKGLVFKETVVMRRWGSETRKLDQYMNQVD